MLRYGSDKPDTRFGLELVDLGDELAGTEFQVFANVLGSGGVIRGLNAGAREVPRKELDALTEHVKRYGAGGLVWAFVQEDGTWRSPTAKFLTEDAARRRHRQARRQRRRPAADRRRQAARGRDRARRAAARARAPLRPRPAGPARRALGRRLPDVRVERGRRALDRDAPPVHRADRRLLRPGRDALARLRHRARRRRDRRRLDPHQPPRGAVSRSSTRSASPRRRPRRASASCSTRCASARRRTAASRSGIDRIAAILAGRDSIRDVIAFPKTASGSDPLTGAPAPVDAAQLAELGDQGHRAAAAADSGSVPQPRENRAKAGGGTCRQRERNVTDLPAHPDPPRLRGGLHGRLDALPAPLDRDRRPGRRGPGRRRQRRQAGRRRRRAGEQRERARSSRRPTTPPPPPTPASSASRTATRRPPTPAPPPTPSRRPRPPVSRPARSGPRRSPPR